MGRRRLRALLCVWDGWMEGRKGDGTGLRWKRGGEFQTSAHYQRRRVANERLCRANDVMCAY